MNTKEMIAVMQAYEDGKQIEAKLLSDPDWYNVEKPLWDWDSFVYRIKTTKKVVDLSVLIDSGIDCEFWNARGDLKQYGPLDEIFDLRYPYGNHIDAFEHCRPRMNHVHAITFDDFEETSNFRHNLAEAGFAFSFDTLDYINGVVLLLWDFDKSPDHCMPWEVSDD